MRNEEVVAFMCPVSVQYLVSNDVCVQALLRSAQLVTCWTATKYMCRIVVADTDIKHSRGELW